MAAIKEARIKWKMEGIERRDDKNKSN